MPKKILVVAIAVLVILLAAVGFFLSQNKEILQKLTSRVPGKTEASPSPGVIKVSPAPAVHSQGGTQQKIIDSVNAQAYNELINYMTAPTVEFILMSSDCCPPQVPPAATQQMSYIKSATPMNFDQENPVVKNLKSKNEQLANTFIGVSESGEGMAAFTIGPDNLISKVELSVSHKLYNQ